MNLRIFAAMAVIMAASGCSLIQGATTAATSNPSPAALAEARNTVYTMKSAYGVAVVLVVDWAKTPLCGRPGALPAPACPTQPAINAMAKADRVVSDAIAKAESLALSASPDQSTLSLAISAAQAAYASFQGAMKTYSIKGA